MNKKGHNNFNGVIFGCMFTIMLILITMMSMGVAGKVVIEKSYATEYAQAKDDLAKCELDLKNAIPVCPAVECKETNGIIFAVIGLLFYIGSLVQIGIYKKQDNEAQKSKAELKSKARKP